MKKLTCEMCGSTDLIKDSGVFVCQTCGCKYTVEEAKKMMIEGTVDVSGSTVKVDTSDKLNNLIVLATRARKEGNTSEAKKYYEMALVEDPTNLETAFYSSYYKVMDGTVGQLPENLNNFTNRAASLLEEVFSGSVHGSGVDMANDFITSSVSLYNFVFSYEAGKYKQEDGELSKFDIDKANRERGYYYKKFQHHREIIESILPCIWNLCSIIQSHSASNGHLLTLPLYDLLDTIYEFLLEHFWGYYTANCHDRECDFGFIDHVLRLEAMRKESNPAYVSRSVDRLIQHLNEDLPHLVQEPHKRKTKNIIRSIETARAKYEQTRIKQYWDAHPEEKTALETELADLENQVSVLKAEIEDIPANKERENIQMRIEALVDEKNALGIFKIKEKKAAQEKIDVEKLNLAKVIESIDAAKKEIEKKIEPLQKKIDAVNVKLEKAQ